MASYHNEYMAYIGGGTRAGGLTFWAIIIVIIIGSVMLAGGIFPKDFKEVRTAGKAVPIEETFPDEDTLQLRTIRFKQCTDTTAVGFLLDNSGSMAFSDPATGQTKMSVLKSSINSFVSKMTNNSVLGITVFSTTPKQLVPYMLVTDNDRGQITAAINSMQADGGTYTRSAFIEFYNQLTQAMQNPQYQKYEFNVIFFSDGIPETAATNQSCPGGIGGPFCTRNPKTNGCRCYAQEEDPTNAGLPGGNPIDQVKNLKNANGTSVRVFSVLLFDPAQDGYFETRFRELMKSAASTRPDGTPYFYETTKGQQLESIFADISTQVCE